MIGLALLWFAASQPATPETCGGEILQKLEWRRHPSASEMERLQPVRTGLPARAETEMLCRADRDGRLVGCALIREEPAGFAFGEALLRAAEFFRAPPNDIEGMPLGDRCMSVRMIWVYE